MTRSKILWYMLAGWSALMLVFLLLAQVMTMPSSRELFWAEHGIAEGEGAVLGWFCFGCVCPLAIWALFGFPMLLAAILARETRD